ncbi:hypothetical protein LB507_000908, partial [Fusarium sp. FIESC RH6]
PPCMRQCNISSRNPIHSRIPIHLTLSPFFLFVCLFVPLELDWEQSTTQCTAQYNTYNRWAWALQYTHHTPQNHPRVVYPVPPVYSCICSAASPCHCLACIVGSFSPLD